MFKRCTWIQQLTRGEPCSVLINVTIWEVLNRVVRKIYFYKNPVCFSIDLARLEDSCCHRISMSGFWAQKWNDNVRYNSDSSYFIIIEIYWSSVSILRYVYHFCISDRHCHTGRHCQSVVEISTKRVKSKYWHGLII